jgi:squalene cyclase
MYALHRYNPTQYALFVKGGVELISRQITTRGSWTSTWYSGEYYGTYICTRLIAAVDPAHPLLPRIAEFLLATQRDDGGWGPDRSNVNDTAFALLTLHALNFDKTSRAMTTGRRFLIDRQRVDGSWQGVNFIRMDPFRTQPARAGSRKNELHYRSDVISSCFCLQALCFPRP